MKYGTSRFECQYMPELLLTITPTSYNVGDITSAFNSVRTKVKAPDIT
jgi:hypothetical protein